MKRYGLFVMIFLVSTVFGQGSDILMDGQPESEMLAKSLQGTCGLRPYDSRYSNSPYLNENRIVNGEHASYGEFPWQVSTDLMLQRPDGTVHRIRNCGASIINEFWLLSAAHCFKHNPTSYVVTVGNHDRRRPDIAEQTFNVETIIRHEQYTGGSDFDHDIALVKIKQSANGRGIQFNYHVQPVCLPDSTTSFQDGTRCIVSGWGKTKDPAYDDMPGVLMKTELELINRQACQQMHSYVRITDRMLCAGDLQGHTSPCDGDSGGGLVCRGRGVYTLLGVVSWATGQCNVPNMPAVFADVLNLLPWIKSNINSYSDSYEQRMLPSRP